MTLTQKPDVDGKRRFSPILWFAGLAGIAVLALGITGTLAAFTSSITNSANNVQTVADGDFGFSESNVDGVGAVAPACAEASAGDALTCATVNKNGATGAAATPMAPGDIRTTTVRMANTATAPNGLDGQLTLTPAPCTQAPPVGAGPPVVSDLCGVVTVAVACAGPAPVLPFTLAATTLTAFNTGAVPPYLIATLAPGEYTDCTFTTTLPSTVTDPG